MAAASRGRAKPGAIDKPWKDALALALNDRGDDGRKLLRHVADACVKAAIGGDVSAMKEIGDRMDGKATQAITGPDGGPLTVQIVRLAG